MCTSTAHTQKQKTVSKEKLLCEASVWLSVKIILNMSLNSGHDHFYLNQEYGQSGDGSVTIFILDPL